MKAIVLTILLSLGLTSASLDIDLKRVKRELPSAAASQVPATPTPFANAAIWQEAVANDKRVGGATAETQYLYALIAFTQINENSSRSIIEDYLEGAQGSSQALQELNMYPTEFNQAQALDPAKTPIEISSTPEQTIKSFGASGAWWPNDLNLFPPEQQKNLSKLLFDKDWLYLSGYRYNIGATGDQDGLQINPALRSVQSFMKTDGTYDWTRDAPGIYYLKAAQDAGVSSIVFFVNAQPSSMTSNHQACGSSLQDANIPSFVQYIEKVVAYWADKGITIDYVSPMNEPDNDFQKCSFTSGCGCGQEGMKVPLATRAAVFQQLRAALASSTSAGAKKVKIMGDETSQVASQALQEYTASKGLLGGTKEPGWLIGTLESKSIDAIAVHMYDWPDDATLKNYKQLVINASLRTTHKSPPPPIKMTEISSFATARDDHAPYGWTGPGIMKSDFDPQIDNALDMARMIWQWMTLVNAESFDWWTALSTMMACSPTSDLGCSPSTYQAGKGWNDALIHIDPSYASNKNYQFYFTKRFWVFKHFTTFFRPGAVRYDIPNAVLPYGTVAMAAKAATGELWSSTFVNRNATAQTITFQLPGTEGKVSGIVQTTASDDWKKLALPQVSKTGTIRVELPARGVLSVQFTVEGNAPKTAIASKVRRKRRERYLEWIDS